MRRLLRRYRTLRDLGVGRLASARAAWRVTFGPEPEYEEWPEPCGILDADFGEQPFHALR